MKNTLIHSKPNFLFEPVTILGKKNDPTLLILEKNNISRIIDLLLLLPRNYQLRQNLISLSQIQPDEIYKTRVKILSININRYRKRHTIKAITNQNEIIELAFFNINKHYLTSVFAVGNQLVICGKINLYNNKYQMIHPKVLYENKLETKFTITYSQITGIHQLKIESLVNMAIKNMPDVEWLDNGLLQENKWPRFKNAISMIHNPININQVKLARWRLSYDEIFSYQIMLHLGRNKLKNLKTPIIKKDSKLKIQLIKKLPFKLTDDQKQAIAQIETDLLNPMAMVRLLQGDVGSGKTLVSLIAMLNVVQSGAQSCIIVPIETLAQQHYTVIKNMLSGMNINITILTSKTTKAKKKKIIEGIKQSEFQIIIGTHSLISDDIEFANLQLIVIDEQHKFGVQQRLKIANKGSAINILSMTATPIPRTLLLTMYGDMDITYIKNKPNTNVTVKTAILPTTKITPLIASLQNAIKNGSKIFWVCPLIDPTDTINAISVNERLEELQKTFKERVGMLHGKIKNKQEIIDAFAKNGTIDILVATTVIEVGIDIQKADIIIIENADRFGLSQLHQLRGRVGRGNKDSSCVLLYDKKTVGKIGLIRLNIMKQYSDGFIIAEKDFNIRGSGNILGHNQSGMTTFHISDINTHKELFKLTKEHLSKIFNQEVSPEYKKNLAVLLRIFNREFNIHSFYAG